MSRRPAIVLWMPGYAVVAALVARAGLAPLVAGAFICPLVLFVPGRAIVTAIDAGAEPDFPGRRHLLAVALSMAVVVLGGLILNAVAALTATAWEVWLVAVTAVATAVGFHRLYRMRGHLGQPGSDGDDRGRPRLSLAVVGLGATAAVALLAGVGILTEVTTRGAFDQPVTQLSLVPGATAPARTAKLSATNLSKHSETVTLTIAGGGEIRTLSLALQPSQTWTRTIVAPGRGPVRASLSSERRSSQVVRVVWHPHT